MQNVITKVGEQVHLAHFTCIFSDFVIIYFVSMKIWNLDELNLINLSRILVRNTKAL